MKGQSDPLRVTPEKVRFFDRVGSHFFLSVSTRDNASSFVCTTPTVRLKLICFQQESSSFKQVCYFVIQVGDAQRVINF